MAKRKPSIPPAGRLPANNRRKAGAGPGRWTKGRSGNPAGRQPGIPNKATADIRDFCRILLADKAYQQGFITAFRDGTLPPRLEEMVWHYGHGRPPQSIDVKGDGMNALAAAIRGDLERHGHAAED